MGGVLSTLVHRLCRRDTVDADEQESAFRRHGPSLSKLLEKQRTSERKSPTTDKNGDGKTHEKEGIESPSSKKGKHRGQGNRVDGTRANEKKEKNGGAINHRGGGGGKSGSGDAGDSGRVDGTRANGGAINHRGGKGDAGDSGLTGKDELVESIPSEQTAEEKTPILEKSGPSSPLRADEPVSSTKPSKKPSSAMGKVFRPKSSLSPSETRAAQTVWEHNALEFVLQVHVPALCTGVYAASSGQGVVFQYKAGDVLVNAACNTKESAVLGDALVKYTSHRDVDPAFVYLCKTFMQVKDVARWIRLRLWSLHGVYADEFECKSTDYSGPAVYSIVSGVGRVCQLSDKSPLTHTPHGTYGVSPLCTLLAIFRRFSELEAARVSVDGVWYGGADTAWTREGKQQCLKSMVDVLCWDQNIDSLRAYVSLLNDWVLLWQARSFRWDAAGVEGKFRMNAPRRGRWTGKRVRVRDLAGDSWVSSESTVRSLRETEASTAVSGALVTEFIEGVLRACSADSIQWLVWPLIDAYVCFHANSGNDSGDSETRVGPCENAICNYSFPCPSVERKSPISGFACANVRLDIDAKNHEYNELLGMLDSTHRPVYQKSQLCFLDALAEARPFSTAQLSKSHRFVTLSTTPATSNPHAWSAVQCLDRWRFLAELCVLLPRDALGCLLRHPRFLPQCKEPQHLTCPWRGSYFMSLFAPYSVKTTLCAHYEAFTACRQSFTRAGRLDFSPGQELKQHSSMSHQFVMQWAWVREIWDNVLPGWAAFTVDRLFRAKGSYMSTDIGMTVQYKHAALLPFARFLKHARIMYQDGQALNPQQYHRHNFARRTQFVVARTLVQLAVQSIRAKLRAIDEGKDARKDQGECVSSNLIDYRYGISCNSPLVRACFGPDKHYHVPYALLPMHKLGEFWGLSTKSSLFKRTLAPWISRTPAVPTLFTLRTELSFMALESLRCVLLEGPQMRDLREHAMDVRFPATDPDVKGHIWYRRCELADWQHPARARNARNKHEYVLLHHVFRGMLHAAATGALTENSTTIDKDGTGARALTGYLTVRCLPVELVHTCTELAQRSTGAVIDHFDLPDYLQCWQQPASDPPAGYVPPYSPKLARYLDVLRKRGPPSRAALFRVPAPVYMMAAKALADDVPLAGSDEVARLSHASRFMMSGLLGLASIPEAAGPAHIAYPKLWIYQQPSWFDAVPPSTKLQVQSDLITALRFAHLSEVSGVWPVIVNALHTHITLPENQQSRGVQLVPLVTQALKAGLPAPTLTSAKEIPSAVRIEMSGGHPYLRVFSASGDFLHVLFAILVKAYIAAKVKKAHPFSVFQRRRHLAHVLMQLTRQPALPETPPACKLTLCLPTGRECFYQTLDFFQVLESALGESGGESKHQDTADNIEHCLTADMTTRFVSCIIEDTFSVFEILLENMKQLCVAMDDAAKRFGQERADAMVESGVLGREHVAMCKRLFAVVAGDPVSGHPSLLYLLQVLSAPAGHLRACSALLQSGTRRRVGEVLVWYLDKLAERKSDVDSTFGRVPLALRRAMDFDPRRILSFLLRILLNLAYPYWSFAREENEAEAKEEAVAEGKEGSHNGAEVDRKSDDPLVLQDRDLDAELGRLQQMQHTIRPGKGIHVSRLQRKARIGAALHALRFLSQLSENPHFTTTLATRTARAARRYKIFGDANDRHSGQESVVAPYQTYFFLEEVLQLALRGKEQAPEEESDDEVPEEFMCPLLGAIMTDPVGLPGAGGYVVDRSAIKQWFLTSQTNPWTRVEFKLSELKPLPELKERIEAYVLERKKTRKEKQDK